MLHGARGWRQRSCPSCRAQPGELCRTPTGRQAGGPHTARLSYGRRELFADEDVWQELERWGATVALVGFSGGGGHPGSVAAVTLEDADKRELARWGHGEEELAEALAAPIWGRYALFRGHPRITGLLLWGVHERRVVVAGERGGEKFDEVLSAPGPPTRLTVIAAAPTTARDMSPGQAAPADQQSSLPARDAGEVSGVCERCGEPLPAGLRCEARYCSKRCRQAASRARLKLQPRKPPSPPPERCSWCGEPMPAGRRAEARFCSKRWPAGVLAPLPQRPPPGAGGVTGTLPGADVRGFYESLGIELPGWAHHEAPVCCFAAPDAHARGDRDPSCSVNVETGAWRCWGCGAKGGAYDAALARGLDSRQAFELKVAYGLAERDCKRPRPSRSVPATRGAGQGLAGQVAATARPSLAMDERQLGEASARLARLLWPPRVLRDEHRRVWSRATLLNLGCGWERGRVLIPIRDRDGGLCGVLRYAPAHDLAPKMLAARGTRLGLVPHPDAEPSEWIVLVEGPPDMISARSQGLPAIAVPGDDAWEPEWARLLVGRHVSVVLDCDPAGRQAAGRIAGDLKAAGVRGSIIDLARDRQDGYDLTDWLDARANLAAPDLRRALGAPRRSTRADRAHAEQR